MIAVRIKRFRIDIFIGESFEQDNVRDNRAAGDVEIVGADKIAKLSAETSSDRAPAASCSSHCYVALDPFGLSVIIPKVNTYRAIL